MAEISTNLVLDGITLALRKAYPKAQIESNAVKQGLRPPAFLVFLVSAGQTAHPNSRWRCTPRFEVVHFPQKGREECYSTADLLCDILETISLPSGDKIRGTDIDFSVVDGLLHFFVSYPYFMYRQKDQEAMDEVQVTTTTEKGEAYGS